MSMHTKFMPSEGDFNLESFEAGIVSLNKIFAYAKEHDLSFESEHVLLRAFVNLNRDGLPDSLVSSDTLSLEADGTTPKKNFIVRAYEWIMEKLKQFWNWLTASKKKSDAIETKAKELFDKTREAYSKTKTGTSLESYHHEKTELVTAIKWSKEGPIVFSELKAAVGDFEKHVVDTIDSWTKSLNEFKQMHGSDDAKNMEWVKYTPPSSQSANTRYVEVKGTASLVDVAEYLIKVQDNLKPKVEHFRNGLATTLADIYKQVEAEANKLKSLTPEDDKTTHYKINDQTRRIKRVLDFLRSDVSSGSDRMLLSVAGLYLKYNPWPYDRSRLN